MSMKIETILIDNSQEILNMSNEAKQQALYKIGLAAEGYAKRLAPVDTGRLRGSITFATQTETGGGGLPAMPKDYEPHGRADENSVYVGTNVEYAIYQEFGVNGREGYHFIRNSLSNHINEYKMLIENTYKKFSGE